MKTRLITAGISIVLMLTVLLIPWHNGMILTFGTSLICAVAVYELFTVTDPKSPLAFKLAAIGFGIAAPFFGRIHGGWIFLICLVYTLVLGALFIMYLRNVVVKRIAIALSLSLFAALALSCMSYLRSGSEHGLFYVILAMLMSWIADSGAYFVGTFLGKHKLCPRISPKKTVEGLIGGIVTSVVVSLIAGWIYQIAVLGADVRLSYGEVFVLALVCAPLSVVGDLFASIIKRIFHVKDFGNCFPGHGGMLDRFDSLLFVLPTVLLVVGAFPLVYSI